MNTKQTHTPGPWQVGSVYGANACTVFAPGDASIASVYGIPLHTMVEDVDLTRWGEGFANARLIAAAPELLDTAKAVLKWADDLEPYAEDGSVLVPVFENLRNAIAKAEGG